MGRKRKKVLVVIDPGHTGRTYNAGAVAGYYESAAMFELSRYEKAALESYGIDVVLTRSLNEDPGLYERGQMAVHLGKSGEYNTVIFESNHSSAFNGKACGVTVIRSAHLPGSEALGNRIADAVVSVMRPVTGITYNRRVTTKIQRSGADWYGVIRGAVSGAVSEAQEGEGPVQYAFIVEHGFHDHPTECTFLARSGNLKKIAEAKARVIAEHFGLSEEKISSSDNSEKDCTPYLVKVNVSSLNIRKKPTALSESCGYTGKGTFTIVKEAEGAVDREGGKGRWGYLKSGRGWICLEYTERAA